VPVKEVTVAATMPLLLLLLPPPPLLAEVHLKAVIVLGPFEMRRVPARHVTYAQRIQTRFVQRADVAISRQNLTTHDQIGANADARQGGSGAEVHGEMRWTKSETWKNMAGERVSRA
jgi:hypothetical protein